MPIRVLHVVTYMGRGGLETMIMNYYRHIDQSKVQFDFLVHRDFRADYDDEIEKLGGVIHHLPKLIPWSLKYRSALDTFFAKHPEYRIVHVHQDCLSSVILKSAQKQGVPVRIAHSHSSSQDKNLKYLVKLYYKRYISKYATELFACGRDAGDWMFGGAEYKVLYNAIDAEQYTYDAKRAARTRRRLGIPQEAFVVGHIGRFHEVKNHAFLLDVFAEVHKRCTDAVLMLVGDGMLRERMEQKARSLGLSKHVIFTGVRNDVPDLLQIMDVFVFPSVYEGLPVSLIEAQASGLHCMISSQISDACMFTSLVHKVSLHDGVNVWAKNILGVKDMERQDTFDRIVDAGYDIGKNSLWLQDYYLKHCGA